MPTFPCPSCRAPLQTASALPPGTVIQCPHCATQFTTPTAAPPPPAPAPAVAGKPACPGCGVTFTLPAGWPAGRTVRCPRCQTAFTPVPAPVAPAPAPAIPAAPVPPDDAFAHLEDESPAVVTPHTPHAGKRRSHHDTPRGRAKKPDRTKVYVLAGVGAVLVAAGVGIAVAMSGGKPPPANPGPPAVAEKTKAKADKAKGRAEPAAKAPGGPETWGQDLEAAKTQAAKESKDLLIFFNGSDWCVWCRRLTQEVLLDGDFLRQAAQKYVLVHIDSPRGVGRGWVQDAARNERAQQLYQVQGFPTVVLADAAGRPYATTGYRQGGAGAYADHLTQQHARRSERDQLFARVEEAKGGDKLGPAADALRFLRDAKLLSHYAKELDGWAKLADEHDPGNAKGVAEHFFEARWLNVLTGLDTDEEAVVTKHVGELDEWRAKNPFKDANRGALLLLVAAKLLSDVGSEEAAIAHLKDAEKLNPTDEKLARVVKAGTAVLGISSGTGFVVSEQGHILTNAHVVGDKARVLVRVGAETVSAEVLARDVKRDIALVRAKLPEGVNLKPVRPADRKLSRGDKVAALGYPLGDAVGSGLKLTTGVVGGVPEAGNENMFVLDARVNPGNSGGPLCDAYGNVVGMITAKSLSARGIDSYGMALPAADLDAFLRMHLLDYEPPTAQTKPLEWNEVDKLVSPSVLMVMQTGK